jgi:hypothetical protein
VEPEVARFLALVRRELGAHDVRVLAADEVEAPGDASRELRCSLPDGLTVLARFEQALPDRDAKQRRLEMLASTFDVVVEEVSQAPKSRPSPAQALLDELRALCERASALNALVVDANSPILWGAARPRDVVPADWAAPAPGGTEAPANEDGGDTIARASRSALEAVRAHVDMSALRKGKRVRHVEREGEAPFLAHSFAGIYLLTLVFAGEFDELRAERAVLEAMPRVERLVLALPPLDPPPREGARAIAIRRPRKR